MLETDIKELRMKFDFKLSNAQDLDLQWEAKAYADCISMLDSVLKKNDLI
ncbi:MAG: hypothetical protein FWC15_01505 [Fibromonadales bacterium]|nr:hypothetical protein [Fibromonadales bacterium]